MSNPGSRSCTRCVAVLYARLPDEMQEDQQDVIDYVDGIARPLIDGGYTIVPVAVTIDLSAMVSRLNEIKPVVVLNLVEALHDHDELLYMVPSVLSAFHFPFTGVNARGNFLTTDKILAKEMLQLADIATPQWQRCDDMPASGTRIAMPCIVKPIAADASRGMDDSSFCRSPEELSAKIRTFAPEGRCAFFAEFFVVGREFNISVLEMEDGVHVLPPAEMTFVDYPPDKPTIVDYKAKWAPDSFEFNHTIRLFDFPESDTPLLEELKSISLRCWNLFGLSGYARVDFRVDMSGKPWVLEINANPCISPDAGFVAAAQKSGISHEQLVNAIVNDALRREAKRSGDEEQKARRRARRKVLDKKR